MQSYVNIANESFVNKLEKRLPKISYSESGCIVSALTDDIPDDW